MSKATLKIEGNEISVPYAIDLSVLEEPSFSIEPSDRGHCFDLGVRDNKGDWLVIRIAKADLPKLQAAISQTTQHKEPNDG